MKVAYHVQRKSTQNSQKCQTEKQQQVFLEIHVLHQVINLFYVKRWKKRSTNSNFCFWSSSLYCCGSEHGAVVTATAI